MSQPVLEVTNLTKQFKTKTGFFTAVSDVSFSIKEGEIVGLLGPNGAGKTTTIQMLLGLITPTTGSIHYFGKNFFTDREYCLNRVGFASAYAHVQARLSVRQNLIIFGGLFGLTDTAERIDKLLTLLDITDLADVLYWKLSAGQQTRVNIVKSLLHSPKLLLMDEPTASLDPEIAAKVVEIIYKLQEEEKVAILYTSHNMAEVEKLCDRVIFLDHGKKLAEDTPLSFTKKMGESKLVIAFDATQKIVKNYLDEKKIEHEFTRDFVVEMWVHEKDIPAVLFGMSKEKIWVTDIDIEKPQLEDVFLAIARGEVYEFKKN